MAMNPEQKEAVGYGEGPLLVVAGPGTGKTRVITERIVHLLSPEFSPPGRSPIGPRNILALTFTDKAAEEMKRRVSAVLPGLTTLPSVCTFHAFCYQTLRQHQVNLRLLDKVDVWIFLRRRIAELGLNYYQKLAEPGAFLHDLNEFFSRCQDELIEPADFERYVDECEQQLRKLQPVTVSAAAAAARSRSSMPSPEADFEREELLKKRELAHVFSTSRRLLEQAGASSLGSLIGETVALWKRQPEVLEEARARYRAVLVDEFQDTNYGQVELLKLLVRPPHNITAVGDDDQAIYRFRGASHGAFEMFGKAFPGHRTVYLSRNYRSTKRILRVATNIIVQNDRYAEKPPLASDRSDGSPVILLKCHDVSSEAFWIADEMERLAAASFSWSQIAVLYRAHSARDTLVEELRRRGIPFAIRGLSILSAPVLRDLLAYLKLIHSNHENVSLTRVLLAPRWHFPEELSQAIREAAWKNRSSLYDVIKDPDFLVAGALSGTGWNELQKLLKGLRRLSKSSSVTDVMDKLVDDLEWRHLPGAPDQVYLSAFREFLKEWEFKSETRRLPEFMEYLGYFVEAGGKIEVPEAANRRDAVQMMTIHAAKGLEFPAVFVIGVSPRKFPVTERKPVIEFPAELRKGPPPPANIHVQEERRLFFVALTRAQDRLYISSVSKSARQQSTFINELLSDPVFLGREIQQIDMPDASLRGDRGDNAGGEARRTSTRAGRNGQDPAQDLKPVKQRPAAWEGQGNLFEDDAADSGNAHASLAGWVSESGLSSASQIQLSATAVEDYLACPLKYKLQHTLRVPTAPQAALTFGSVMHQSIRHYFELRRSSLPSFADIEAFYLKRWRGAGFDDEYHEETYRAAGLEQLRAFVDRHNAMKMDCSRIQMEQAFRIEAGGAILDGRIDQITLLDPAQEGAIELTDYKTGRPRTQKDADKSLQLSIYAVAAKKALHLSPVRLTFYNLTSNDPVSTVRMPEDLDNAMRKVEEVGNQIRSGHFDPKPGVGCRWCNFVPICPAHEGG